MAFKITSQEKKLILKRRKVQAQDDFTENSLRKLCRKYTDFLELSEPYEDLEDYAEAINEGEANLSPELTKAVEVAINLQDKLVRVLVDIVKKKESMYGKIKNKVVVTLGL